MGHGDAAVASRLITPPPKTKDIQIIKILLQQY